MNKFMLNETSYHGAGAIQAIPEEIKSRGFKKAFVASDPDLVKFGVTQKVTDLLDKAGFPYSVYSEMQQLSASRAFFLSFRRSTNEISQLSP